MTISGNQGRRKFLKMTASLAPLSYSVSVFALEGKSSDSTTLHFIEKQYTNEGIREGAVVVVDTSANTFEHDGLYLYPDWGKPVVYDVRRCAEQLAFYYPGAPENAIPAWHITEKRGAKLFSGKVEGILETESIKHFETDNLSWLQVPEYPAS